MVIKRTESTPKLKDHITPKGARMSRTLETKFGVSLDDFSDAMTGNEEKARRIGELARQGRMSSDFAPQLAAAYNEIINGTTAYNRAMAEVLVNAGRSSIEIDKSAMGVALGNKSYMNNKREIAQDYDTATRTESTRHAHQMNYGQIKGYIDAYLVSVDNSATILDQVNRPEMKQISADESHKSKVMKELLAKGNKARVEMIPSRNYDAYGFRESIGSKFASLRSAIGI
jgi:hypothetical protein